MRWPRLAIFFDKTRVDVLTSSDCMDSRNPKLKLLLAESGYRAQPSA